MIADAPRGLRIEPAYATGPGTRPLWLPPGLQRRAPSDKTEIIAVGHGARKLVYFKGRLYVKDRSLAPSNLDTRWYGGIRRAPYNLDLDEPGHDGTTMRYHMHLYLAGLLERVSGGRFVHQDSDERDDQSLFEEVPELAHSVDRWAAFWRRER